MNGIMLSYLLSARTHYHCPFGLVLQERRLSVEPVPRYSPAHLCQSVDGFIPIVHCPTEECYPHLTYLSLLRN